MARRAFARLRPFAWGAGSLVLVVAGAYAYYLWANIAPEFYPPAVTLPRPNAYNEFVAATARIRAAPGAAATNRKPAEFDPRAPIGEQRAMVDANAGVLRDLRRAFRHDYLEPPQYSFAALYPHYARFRNAARGFACASNVAAADERWGEAADRALDAVEMGTKVPRGGPLIAGLVGIAITNIGCAALEPALPHLQGRDLERAMARVRRLRRSLPPFAETMEAERLMARAGLIEQVRRTRSPWHAFQSWKDLVGESYGGYPQNRFYVLTMVFANKRGALESIDRYFATVIAESKKAWGQARRPLVPTDPISQVLAPVFTRGHERWVRAEAQLAAIETWLAARLYQDRSGRLPRDSRTLRAAFPSLPDDPFSGRPCVYRGTGDSFLVYSVGPDARDDGGLPLSPRSASDGAPGDLVVGRMFPKQPLAQPNR